MWLRIGVIIAMGGQMAQDLTGRTAIVTGAGRGIGKAITIRIAAAGAHVVVATRTASQAEAVVATIAAAGGSASAFAIDVTDQARVAALVADTAERFGSLDILVHAAADIPYGRIASLSDADFDRCWTSIVKAAFWLTQAAIPHLSASGHGRIVLISSINGNARVINGLTHYAAAKAALNAFGRGAAIELAAQGITVNMINPGLIASDRMRDMVPPEQEARMTAAYPIKRAGTPDEVAAAVMTFLPDDAAYITGAALTIDGGATL